MIHSWESLEPKPLESNGAITSAFLQLGKQDFRSAGQYIQALPYGRNTHPSDLLIVLTEERGTCSTKHALLRRLAIEQEQKGPVSSIVAEKYNMLCYNVLELSKKFLWTGQG